MAKFSTAFKIRKTQAELDFVDVRLSKDNLVFLDPFAIAQRPERWSHECHLSLMAFFQRVVDDIRAGHHNEARQLLSYLREPNETRLGFSAGRPQGAGIGKTQAEQLYEALKGSAAVKTGFLSSLEECELMIEGIGRDKISDLTTNIIRSHLVEYTKDQCTLLGVPFQQVPLSPCFDTHQMTWVSRYGELPVWHGQPIMLVPKAIVRFDPAYEHGKYYRHFVLPFLQVEHLRADSSLVHTLKGGARRVYKKIRGVKTLDQKTIKQLRGAITNAGEQAGFTNSDSDIVHFEIDPTSERTTFGEAQTENQVSALVIAKPPAPVPAKTVAFNCQESPELCRLQKTNQQASE